MKYLILIVTLLYVSEGYEVNEEWRKFKEKFKSHTEIQERSNADDLQRYEIFKTNLEQIEKHNKEADAGLHTYRLGINQFSDLSSEELKKLTEDSEVIIPNTNKKPETEEVPLSGQAVPSSLDWREKNVVNVVKNQKQCGSCWAFSAVGAIESAYAIKTGNLLSLSEQFLVDCDYIDYGCKGGYPGSVFRFATTSPMVLESNYPYTASQGMCWYNPFKKKVLVRRSTTIKWGSEAALLNAIQVSPVSVCFHVTDTFYSYESGVYSSNTCGNSSLKDCNHAMLLIGYGTSDGNDYWLLKNSWDTTWGEKGYARVSRNKNNQCGIANWAVYPSV